MGVPVGAVRPGRRMQGVAAGAAAVALVGGGFVTASLGSVGVPEAQAAVIPSTVGYTEAVYTASYPSTFLGAVAASSSDAKKAGVSTSLPWWCYDWATANNRKVSASSVSTFASADAALVNYVIQNYQDTPANHPAIAAAVHLKLDQGRAKNTKGQWGYDARRASGTFKKRIDQAKNMLAAAADRRGPYKLAPAVALSSDKKSITLTETYIKTAVGKKGLLHG